MREHNPNFKPVPVFAKIGQKIIIFNQENQILFLRRSQKCTRPGEWDFPGGGLEFGEDPVAGIIREVDEETRIEVSNISPLHLESVINQAGDFVIIICYIGYASDTIVDLSWEHDNYEWFDKEKALQQMLPEMHKKFLMAAIEKSRAN